MKDSKQNPHLNPLPKGEEAAKRQVRALLGLLLATMPFCGLASCETSNYIPPVTPQMVARSHGKRTADLSTLEHGRKLFVHRCIECHTLPPIWKYSREDWPQIVNDMSRRASLKSADREAVAAYILAVRSQE